MNIRQEHHRKTEIARQLAYEFEKTWLNEAHMTKVKGVHGYRLGSLFLTRTTIEEDAELRDSGGSRHMWVYYIGREYRDDPIYLDHYSYEIAFFNSQDKDSVMRDLKEYQAVVDWCIKEGLSPRWHRGTGRACMKNDDWSKFSDGQRHTVANILNYHENTETGEVGLDTCVRNVKLWLTTAGEWEMRVMREYTYDENKEAGRHPYDDPYSYHPMRERGFLRPAELAIGHAGTFYGPVLSKLLFLNRVGFPHDGMIDFHKHVADIMAGEYVPAGFIVYNENTDSITSTTEVRNG